MGGGPKGPSDAQKAALARQEEDAANRTTAENQKKAERTRSLRSNRRGRFNAFTTNGQQGVTPQLGVS